MEYSSLFTSGLRAVSSAFSRTSSGNASSSASSSAAVPAPKPSDASRRFLQPPPNPTLVQSPSRRRLIPSPRRKTRSSFTTHVSSPLAGVKTPVRAADIAAKMSSMLLSPAAAASSRSAHRRRSSREVLEISPEVAGAPIKPRPMAKRGRRLAPPPRKPPPSLPLPSIPSTDSSPSSLPPPLPLPTPSSSSLSFPTSSSQNQPHFGSAHFLRQRSTPQQHAPTHPTGASRSPFMPLTIPGVTVLPATPPSILVIDDDDVFGSAKPYRRPSQPMRVPSFGDSDTEEMDLVMRPDSSPIHGGAQGIAW